MIYSLNSSKGITYGIIKGTIIGPIKGDTRSLDYSSHGSVSTNLGRMRRRIHATVKVSAEVRS